MKDNGRKAGQDFRSQVQRDVKLGPEHTLAADAVIVCAGGASYPGTGSDGNFVPVLKKMGVAVEPLLPALVYLQPEDGFIGELEGLALKNIEAVSYTHLLYAHRRNGPTGRRHHAVWPFKTHWSA